MATSQQIKDVTVELERRGFSAVPIPGDVTNKGTIWNVPIRRFARCYQIQITQTPPPPIWFTLGLVVWRAGQVATGQSFLEYTAKANRDACGIAWAEFESDWLGLQRLGVDINELGQLSEMFVPFEIL